MAVCRGQIAPANDAGHTGFGIVDHRREGVGEGAVAATHHRVAHLGGGILIQDEAALVAELDATRRERGAQRLVRVAPGSRADAALATRPGVASSSVGRFRGVSQRRSGTPAAVQHARFGEAVEGRGVGFRLIALSHDAIEVQAQGLDVALQGESPLGPAALRIEILEPQHEGIAARPGVEPAEQGGEQGARVGRARGRRREATDAAHGYDVFGQGARSACQKATP